MPLQVQQAQKSKLTLQGSAKVVALALARFFFCWYTHHHTKNAE
jgi:hypothetical protein